MTDNVHPM